MRNGVVVSLALLLAGGCGGGGGGSSSPEPVATPPPAPPSTTDDSGNDDQIAISWSLERTDPNGLGIASNDIDALLDHVFTDEAAQGAIVIRRGHVVGERYATGFDVESLGTSWSVAKSIYATAIGIAIDDGDLALDTPASQWLDEWTGTDNEETTVRHILEMRAGLENAPIFVEADQTEYALSQSPVRDAGTRFEYSNPTSQLFEPLLLRATGRNAHEFIAARIFTPIGIEPTSVGFWFDPTAMNSMTYCCLDMTIEDFARYGLLMLNGGSWDATSIVSEDFVTTSRTAQSAFYGLQWWIMNDAYFGRASPLPISVAQGLDGQRIYVWDEFETIVVVLSQYDAEATASHVLSLTNWPRTCTARNTCAASTGEEVPGYDEWTFLSLLAALDDSGGTGD